MMKLRTICIFISFSKSTVTDKPEPHIPVQTHLWPAASGPVCWTGDVCVAGGKWLRFGYVLTSTGLQGFLLLSTYCLDAEHCPFSQARAPAARWAFLPLPSPPSTDRKTKDANVSNLMVHLWWKITFTACGWHCARASLCVRRANSTRSAKLTSLMSCGPLHHTQQFGVAAGVNASQDCL